MASPQPTDSHTRISNELYTQILMRDFSKRQRSILDLILRLSYGCGKKRAFIPQQKHFEVCGVGRNKIKGELERLKSAKVIDWDEFTSEYWVVKDYDVWEINIPEMETQELFHELLRVNLEHSRTSQNGNSSSQNGNFDSQNGNCVFEESSQNGNQEVPKTGTEQFPKRELEPSEKSMLAWVESLSITNDNYIYKKIDDERNSVYVIPIRKKAFEVFGEFRFSEKVIQQLSDLLFPNHLPVELAFEAIDVTQTLKKDEGFTVNKLRRWLQRGVKTASDAVELDKQTFGPKQTAFDKNDALFGQYLVKKGDSANDRPGSG